MEEVIVSVVVIAVLFVFDFFVLKKFSKKKEV